MESMQPVFPVRDFIGMVEEINSTYERSEETRLAAVCYEKCEDLMAFIPEDGYIYKAHTHLILALLASAKDPNTPGSHLKSASNYVKILFDQPQNFWRKGELDTLQQSLTKEEVAVDIKALFIPYPDIAMLKTYDRCIDRLYAEHVLFFSEEKEASLVKDNKINVGEYKTQEFELEVVDPYTGERIGEPRRGSERLSPLVSKSVQEMDGERFELKRSLWRYMCRELMKGGRGCDVGDLGGAEFLKRDIDGEFAGMNVKGVLELWADVKELWLARFWGYGGMEEGGLMQMTLPLETLHGREHCECWKCQEIYAKAHGGLHDDMQDEKLQCKCWDAQNQFLREHGCSIKPGLSDNLMCECWLYHRERTEEKGSVLMPTRNVDWYKVERDVLGWKEQYTGYSDTANGGGYQWDF